MAMKFIISLLIILLSYFAYTVVVFLDLDSPVQYKNNEKCKRIELEMPTEDLALFQNFIIGATSDSIQTFYLHYSAAKAKPGYLISIEKTSKEVKRIRTLNFPSNFQMNAHGIKVFNDKTLYVISHSYSKGGERIFIFDLEVVNGEVQATYQKSYYFEGDHGKYNAIALVDENHFYLTQWIPFPDEPEGRDNSPATGLNRILTSIYRAVNPIKFCVVLQDDLVKCDEMAYGNMPNGVWYQKNKLFVADSTDKSIRIYQVLNNFQLKSEGKVDIGHSVDNLWALNGEIYTAGIVRGWNYIAFSDAIKKGLSYEKIPGGVSKIYLSEGKWQAENVIVQDLADLVSSVVVTDEIIMASVIDPALVVCPIPSN